MIIETLPLDSGIVVTLTDRTRHYFGGYFHVQVLVSCEIAVKKSYFTSDVAHVEAVRLLGSSVRFERTLEKMAVPETSVVPVRDQLCRSFHNTSLAYISSVDFPPRFVRSEYVRLAKKSPSFNKDRI